MNLNSNVQEDDGWFRGVALLSTLGPVAVIIAVLAFLFWRELLIF